MAEYIEREAFIEILKETKNDCKHYPNKVVCDFAIKMANLMPSVDVQEVVRCKDCRWRSTEECAMYYRCNCGEQHTWECDNDFCSYGERICGAKMVKE